MRSVFRLAPQSTALLVVTTVLFPLPFGMLAVALYFRQPLVVATAIFMLVLWAFIWSWMRPPRFVVTADGLRIE